MKITIFYIGGFFKRPIEQEEVKSTVASNKNILGFWPWKNRNNFRSKSHFKCVHGWNFCKNY